jgi:radical SAM protein with 4Fe4S-binding SPASM domain
MPLLDINKVREIPRGEKLKEVRSLVLTLTSSCNLRCSYCYEKHDQRDKKIMELSTAKEAITRYLDADDIFDRVSIEFFGGEPMMAFPLIRDIVQWTNSRKWKKNYMFFIGTNGTILTEEIKEWLLKNRSIIQVAISIDGCKKAHDITRDNSYDVVRRNLDFFKEQWPHQASKMTISAETIPYVAESILELEEIGLFFTANIGFEDMWGDENKKKSLLCIYEDQLSQLVDYYAERPHLYPVSPLMTAVPEFLGLSDAGESQKKEKSIKRFCGAGHEMILFDVDGQIYPCHRFLPWVTGQPAPDFAVNCQMAWKPDECSECKLILSCPTCAGFNWESNNDTGIRTTFHCEAHKLEVLASSKLEAIRLAQKINKLTTLSLLEKKRLKKRLEAVWDLIDNGI